MIMKKNMQPSSKNAIIKKSSLQSRISAPKPRNTASPWISSGAPRKVASPRPSVGMSPKVVSPWPSQNRRLGAAMPPVRSKAGVMPISKRVSAGVSGKAISQIRSAVKAPQKPKAAGISGMLGKALQKSPLGKMLPPKAVSKVLPGIGGKGLQAVTGIGRTLLKNPLGKALTKTAVGKVLPGVVGKGMQTAARIGSNIIGKESKPAGKTKKIFGNVFGKGVKAISKVVKTGVKLGKAGVKKASGVGAALKDGGRKLGKAGLAKVVQLGSKIKAGAVSGINKGKSALNAVKREVAGFGEGVKDSVVGIWDGLKGAAKGVANWTKAAAVCLTTPKDKRPDWAKEGVRAPLNSLREMGEGVKTIIKDPIGTIKQVGTMVKETVKEKGVGYLIGRATPEILGAVLTGGAGAAVKGGMTVVKTGAKAAKVVGKMAAATKTGRKVAKVAKGVKTTIAGTKAGRRVIKTTKKIGKGVKRRWAGAKKKWNGAKGKRHRLDAESGKLNTKGTSGAKPNQGQGFSEKGYNPKPGERSMTKTEWKDVNRQARIDKNGATTRKYKQGTPTQGQGFSSKGYNPAPGERTFEGYVRNTVSPDAELKLRTNSAKFNNNSKGVGGEFKRYGNGSHGGIDPHVHQPKRNVNTKTGDIYGGTYEGKTGTGRIDSPNRKDVKQLYDHVVNGKYN